MTQTTILIVEDEMIVAADLANKLGKLGYKVVGSADSGEESILMARELRPDLVLMDIILAGQMDGVEAAEQIRREFDLPVIFLTAHSDRATLERAKRSEPCGYILKPFEERELATQIELDDPNLVSAQTMSKPLGGTILVVSKDRLKAEKVQMLLLNLTEIQPHKAKYGTCS